MTGHCFPRLRWLALAWLVVYLPAYALAYGLANFLFLCNLTVFLAAVGIWTCSRLLLSSQAVAMVVVGVLWTVDLASRLLTGGHLIGGTEYMWDPRWPLFTRLLSLYHAVLPALLVVVLRRIGYDRRGYLLQSAIALVVVSAGRLFGPEANINHAFVDPVLKQAWGGALTQVGVIVGALVLVVYPATHLLLVRLCPWPQDEPRWWNGGETALGAGARELGATQAAEEAGSRSRAASGVDRAAQRQGRLFSNLR